MLVAAHAVKDVGQIQFQIEGPSVVTVNSSGTLAGYHVEADSVS
jgi:hypothetical protein